MKPVRDIKMAGASCSLAGGVGCGDNEEGAALVEMALSVAVFLSLLIGFVYFIFGLYTYNFVADAARDASRYASTRGSQCSNNTPILPGCTANVDEIQTFVKSMPYPFLDTRNLTVTSMWLQANTTGATGWTASCRGGCSNAPGNMVSVKVTYAYPISVPFWARTTIDVSSTSQMVISQ